MDRILHSIYIIDGKEQELTPAQILQECSIPGMVPGGNGPCGTLADETSDFYPEGENLPDSDVDALSEQLTTLGKRPLPLPFAAQYTAGMIARALLDAIWMGGHFRLGDLNLKGEWKWNDKAMGLAAAFYASVEKAGEYMDALGLKFSQLQFASGTPSVHFKAYTTSEDEDPEDEEVLFRELPFRTANPRISTRRKCSASILPETSDWLVYIPFDSCDFRLGGSALAQISGNHPTAPDIGDADYFIDCYEVVRELVEDGIVKAGATVGDGGLLTTLKNMAGNCGADISIGDICRAYGGETRLRVLFSEVPGVILQIADLDYDYLDAELLLQDVAYFPLGHPAPGSKSVSVLSSDASGINGILESLLNTLEGED